MEFFSYTMTLEQYLRLNWYSLPANLIKCAENSQIAFDRMYSELETQCDEWESEANFQTERADSLSDQVEELETRIEELRAENDRLREIAHGREPNT